MLACERLGEDDFGWPDQISAIVKFYGLIQGVRFVLAVACGYCFRIIHRYAVESRDYPPRFAGIIRAENVI